MNPLETYLTKCREIHATGAGVAETSYYGTLERLFEEIGKTLKPKVRCVINLANRGAGLPDGGLLRFTVGKEISASATSDHRGIIGRQEGRNAPDARLVDIQESAQVKGPSG